MIGRTRIAWFLIGALVGGLVSAPTGALVAYEMKQQHPRFTSELLSHLPGASPAAATAVGNLGDVTVKVNTAAGGRAISPYIYGVAAAGPQTLRQLGATLNRWGGDNSSRYNWVLGNAWNASRDWDFRNGNYGIQGNAADQFVQGTDQAGAAALVTVPSLGWVANDTSNSTQSVGVPSQGGSPLTPDGSAIAGYDPAANRALTSLPAAASDPGNVDATPAPSGPVYEDQWVHQLQSTFGNGAPPFYAIDNEPDLWCEVQTDVHPACMSYDQMASMFEQYASAVRKQAPNAQILGPVLSGWTGMFFSSLDRGTDNFATHADRSAHSGEAFLPWWLQQIHRYDKRNGVRTLDVVDVHWYPQGQGVYSPANDPATAALRVRSVRALWDPTYTDESWIGQPVYLLPRLKDWVAQDYPGTKVGLSEYNFGGEGTASGAVALAEALGTFG
ncbi:MAG: glycoside hydrolase family 44 protein, partial [Candidatus Dormiibacterota bacterium]